MVYRIIVTEVATEFVIIYLGLPKTGMPTHLERINASTFEQKSGMELAENEGNWDQ